ncbi:cyclopropane-fatty-acyl-phospholipid synthase [Planctomycetia bacterium]|nr:cyclopropane-fatty-acyl-phospholipid synthase [Planctomycetia bacterium]
MSLLSLSLDAVERGLIPDVLTRAAIRRLCEQRLRDCDRGNDVANSRALEGFVESMRSGPIAPVPEKANEQHYELPPEFFAAVLGPHRKYSSCFWPTAETSLAEAEAASLEITCERADLADGQDVLELGCGWGSLSLWMAERFHNSRITAVSNSAPQRRFIETEAASRGLTNLRVITADINQFATDPHRFDRVVSVEMFEHMRNYERLLERIASWLRPDGKLFVHHFCHRQFAYPFETDGDTNWMGRCFFTGGLMPSENMLSHFNRHMTVIEQWRWDGTHYQRTSEAWLANLDAHRLEVLPILEATYGPEAAQRWFHRWRLFFLAVAELFGYANGTEWFVSHSLLQRNGA